MKPPTPRQERIAAVYSTDIWPLFPGRAAELVLRGLPEVPIKRAFEVGCANGFLSLDVAARLAPGGSLTSVDVSPALIALANAEKVRRGSPDRVAFQVRDVIPPFPVEDGQCDLAFCNLALSEAKDRAAALAPLGRCVGHGGTLLATFPMRGCWAEFHDIYRAVLTEQRKSETLGALRAHEEALPRPDELARWWADLGLARVSVETARWELLFKSAREFFFSPVVELGPLAQWKQIAGGRGDEMQDVFFFVKEAIDAYFSDRPFPVTVVVGCVKGERP